MQPVNPVAQIITTRSIAVSVFDGNRFSIWTPEIPFSQQNCDGELKKVLVILIILIAITLLVF